MIHGTAKAGSLELQLRREGVSAKETRHAYLVRDRYRSSFCSRSLVDLSTPSETIPPHFNGPARHDDDHVFLPEGVHCGSLLIDHESARSALRDNENAAAMV